MAEIKVDIHIDQDEKIAHAINGDNGLWLCSNHHKLFDSEVLGLFSDSSVKYRSPLSESHLDYLNEVTTVKQISDNIMTEGFIHYLAKRNQDLREELYVNFT